MLTRICGFLGVGLVALWLVPAAGADEPEVINEPPRWHSVFFLDVINNCSFPVRYDRDQVWVEPGKFRRLTTHESGQSLTIKLDFSAKDRVKQRVETYIVTKTGAFLYGMRVEVRDEHFPKTDESVTPPPIALEKTMFTNGIWTSPSGYKLGLHHKYEQKEFTANAFDPNGGPTYSLKGKMIYDSLSMSQKTDNDEVTLLLKPDLDLAAASWTFKALVEFRSRDPETGKWTQLNFAGPMLLTPGGDAPASRAPDQLWPVGRIELKDVKKIDTGSLKTPDVGLHLVRTAKTPEEEQRAIENVFKTLSAAGVNFKRNLSPGLTPPRNR